MSNDAIEKHCKQIQEAHKEHLMALTLSWGAEFPLVGLLLASTNAERSLGRSRRENRADLDKMQPWHKQMTLLAGDKPLGA